MLEDNPLSVTVSCSFKANLGNYESADVFLSVSGVTMDTTETQIVEVVEGPGRIAYEHLKRRVYERAQQLKAK